ncbi:MAG: glycine cleavage system protein GcvH [Planctomycetota bacterium]
MDKTQLLYAETHEWTHIQDDGEGKIATIGLTDHAIEALTDLVYMDLPSTGTTVSSGAPFGEVESVKATSDLYSPVDGEVTDVNTSLPDNLDVLSTDPFGDGWIIKVRLTDEAALVKLMNLEDYEKLCSDS